MALTNKLTAIADAIREKTETTASLTLDEMPVAIAGISTMPDGIAHIHTGNSAPSSDIGVDGDIYILLG